MCSLAAFLCVLLTKSLNLVPVNEYKHVKIGNEFQFPEDIEIMKAICSVPFDIDYFSHDEQCIQLPNFSERQN